MEMKKMGDAPRGEEDDENENENGEERDIYGEEEQSRQQGALSLARYMSRSNKAGRWTLGIIVLLGVVFIWVFSGVLMQYIFTDADFDHPFFLTYFSTSLFTVYLLDFLRELPWRRLCGVRDEKEERKVLVISEPAADSISHISSINKTADENGMRTEEQSDDHNLDRQLLATNESDVPYTFWQAAKISLIFCPIWFAANYSYNKSLSLTSVSSNTILSSSSSLGTLFLGSLLGVDSFSFGKLIAVAMRYSATKKDASGYTTYTIISSLGGVAMVALTDSKSAEGDSLAGDILCLIGAAFYALYVVLLKLLIKDESKLNTRRFFGLVGLFCILLIWPFGFLLHFTGIEPFELPKGFVWLYLTINGLIGTVLSDFLWLWAVLLTSPLVATVGLSLTIPLAMLADIVLKGKSFGWFYLLGSGLVVSGFLLVNCDDLYLRFQRHAWAWIRRNLIRRTEVVASVERTAA